MGEEETTEGPDYGSAVYWDERYERCTDLFDWYESWETLKGFLGELFTGDEFVLNIGCGNSPMAVDLTKSFNGVVNIDISPVVIDFMEKNFSAEHVLWMVMDCTDLQFGDSSFELVFDKGTIDALLCGDNGVTKLTTTLQEVYRVLTPHGFFVEITYGAPENRLRLFELPQLDWKLYDPIVLNPGEQQAHYIYIFEKDRRATRSHSDSNLNVVQRTKDQFWDEFDPSEDVI